MFQLSKDIINYELITRYQFKNDTISDKSPHKGKEMFNKSSFDLKPTQI